MDIVTEETKRQEKLKKQLNLKPSNLPISAIPLKPKTETIHLPTFRNKKAFILLPFLKPLIIFIQIFTNKQSHLSNNHPNTKNAQKF